MKSSKEIKLNSNPLYCEKQKASERMLRNERKYETSKGNYLVASQTCFSSSAAVINSKFTYMNPMYIMFTKHIFRYLKSLANGFSPINEIEDLFKELEMQFQMSRPQQNEEINEGMPQNFLYPQISQETNISQAAPIPTNTHMNSNNNQNEFQMFQNQNPTNMNINNNVYQSYNDNNQQFNNNNQNSGILFHTMLTNNPNPNIMNQNHELYTNNLNSNSTPQFCTVSSQRLNDQETNFQQFPIQQIPNQQNCYNNNSKINEQININIESQMQLGKTGITLTNQSFNHEEVRNTRNQPQYDMASECLLPCNSNQQIVLNN